MEKGLLEIACFNKESALLAANAGADRIELCREKSTDGLTPYIETIAEILANITIPIRVMIRPRSGNFVYSEAEFFQMREEISVIKTFGVQGFVFGCLNPDGSIQMDQNKQLLQLAYPQPCTFHKAFDVCNEQEKALQDLIALGFETVLTSGGKTSAMEGANKLKLLKVLGQGKIHILVGGSVRSNNLIPLKEACGLNQFHSSAILDGGELADENEIKRLKQHCK